MNNSGVNFANKSIRNVYQCIIDEVYKNTILINEINQKNSSNYKFDSQWLKFYSNMIEHDRFMQGFISTINPLINQLKVLSRNRAADRFIQWETEFGTVSVIIPKVNVKEFFDLYDKLI